MVTKAYPILSSLILVAREAGAGTVDLFDADGMLGDLWRWIQLRWWRGQGHSSLRTFRFDVRFPCFVNVT